MISEINDLLSAYDPNREIDISWLYCDTETLRERIREHVSHDGRRFTMREVCCYIRSISHKIGKRIIGDEAYDEEFAQENPWTESTEEFIQTWKEISKILKEEAHLAGRDMCIVAIHTLIDRLRYQPYGDEVHSNDELDYIFQKLYRGEQLTETEQNLMMESVRNEPRFDYVTWWDEFTR